MNFYLKTGNYNIRLMYALPLMIATALFHCNAYAGSNELDPPNPTNALAACENALNPNQPNQDPNKRPQWYTKIRSLPNGDPIDRAYIPEFSPPMWIQNRDRLVNAVATMGKETLFTYGMGGIGKTSLWIYMSSSVIDSANLIILVLSTKHAPSNYSSLAKEIEARAYSSMGTPLAEARELSIANEVDFFEFLDTVASKHYLSTGKELIIVLEEANDLKKISDPNYPKVYQSLLKQTSLKLILSNTEQITLNGLKPPRQLFIEDQLSRLAKELKTFHFEPENAASIKTYLEQLTEGDQIEITEDGINALYEATRGSIFAINQILWSLPAAIQVINREAIYYGLLSNIVLIKENIGRGSAERPLLPISRTGLNHTNQPFYIVGAENNMMGHISKIVAYSVLNSLSLLNETTTAESKEIITIPSWMSQMSHYFGLADSFVPAVVEIAQKGVDFYIYNEIPAYHSSRSQLMNEYVRIHKTKPIITIAIPMALNKEENAENEFNRRLNTFSRVVNVRMDDESETPQQSLLNFAAQRGYHVTTANPQAIDLAYALSHHRYPGRIVPTDLDAAAELIRLANGDLKILATLILSLDPYIEHITKEAVADTYDFYLRTKIQYKMDLANHISLDLPKVSFPEDFFTPALVMKIAESWYADHPMKISHELAASLLAILKGNNIETYEKPIMIFFLQTDPNTLEITQEIFDQIISKLKNSDRYYRDFR